MKLADLQEQKGTYSAVRFGQDTVDALIEVIEGLGILNPTPSDELHATLLYSRKYLPKYRAKGVLTPPWTAKPASVEIWNTRNGKKAAVIKLDSFDLIDRHHFLMDVHGATYDFPEYKPHITLSYDYRNDYTAEELTKMIKSGIPQLEIVEEYQEDLNLDWKA
jgi:hypothetical protein